MARRSVSFLAAAAVVSAGLACSKPAPPDAQIPSDGVPPAKFDLPLDAYRLANEADGAVRTARDILIQRCAAPAGVQWEVLDRRGWATPDDWRRYGVTQIADAHSLGYHLPPLAPANQRSLTSNRDPSKLSPSERFIIYGSGVSDSGFGGCWGEASRALRLNEAEAQTNVPNIYGNDAYDRALADDRVVAARRAWVSCMKVRGYDYPGPEAPPGDRARFNISDPQPSPAEISTAVADVECRTQTRYTVTLYAVDSAFQQQLIQEHFEQLQNLKQLQEEVVRRASDVIARG